MGKTKKPELIVPAGDWASLHSAIDAGADSVYFGVKGLNMRASASNFDILEIDKVMDLLKANGKKGYLSLNVIVYNNEINKVKKILKAAKKSGVDAVILWDMAVFSLAKEIGLDIHLSTQASVSNIEALKFFASLGVRRVVLARECSLSEIKKIIRAINKEKLDCEIETFIHGAMCVSISGRCFLSQYSFSKSANRGECIQPCRREFEIRDMWDESGYLLGKDYVLSPKDLCTLPILDELISSGIHAFKIEGRTRAPEYVKVVTGVYRNAIDLFYEKKLNDNKKHELTEKLRSVYNRGFSLGFYPEEPDTKDKSTMLENEYEKIYLGEVMRFYKKINVAEIFVRNEEIKVGQELLFIGKNAPSRFFKVTELEKEHEPVVSCPKGERVGVKMPFIVKPKDKVFIWRRKQHNL